jgi:phosphatidylglycerol---prolipoprotein diacylglyceryl transferase
MIDTHFHPEHWGIRPILFYLGSWPISTYSFFVLLGLAIGLTVYFYEARRQKMLNERSFYIVFGSLVGGILGAKILELIINYGYVFSHLNNVEIIFSGRTIVGGLIGGVIGAKVTKKILGIKEKRGNLFAPAIALGVAVGRLGCFFQGCCYGKPTILPWGVDFGDGVLRHPTQIYESIFMLVMFMYLEKIKNRSDIKAGQLFKVLAISYFIFRFFIEFIRVEKPVFYSLTAFQLISLGVIIYLVKDNIASLFLKSKLYGKQQYK